jgi:glutamyl-Q tRNA(Asp) synthetase
MGHDSRSRAKFVKNTVSRFAPSPTGRLHLGHAFSALKAHDFARAREGTFYLRIEDIDPGRARAEFVDGIIEDVEWLGMMPDGEIVYQSERLDLYGAALDRLKEMGLVYPCFCTRSAIAAEIAASAAAPHGPEGFHYPGSCRRLHGQERALRTASEPHAWRLDMQAAIAQACSGESRSAEVPPLGSCLRRSTLVWMEGDKEMPATPEEFGDVVIARKDAPTSYHLAVTVDDAAQGVTDVVRGEDLRASTHIHRLLQALLDLPTPTYHHHELLLDGEGRRLAKRNGAPTLALMRAAGVDGEKLAAQLRTGQIPGGYSAGTS